MTIAAKALLEYDRSSAAGLGIGLLKPEAKMILSLMAEGPMPVKALMTRSGLSYRGFYIVQARLLDAGLIEVEAAASDKRVRMVSLAKHRQERAA